MNGISRTTSLLVIAAVTALSGAGVSEAIAPKGDRQGAPPAAGEFAPPGGGQGADPRPGKGREPEHAHGDKPPKEKPAEKLPPLAEPRAGRSVGARPARGRVKVRLPGSPAPIPLEEAASVPMGSVVDATRGSVTLVASGSGGRTGQATFAGAGFRVTQSGAAAVTELRLVGGSFDGCRARRSLFGRISAPLAGISRRRRTVRRLWANGKGSFRTRGRYGAATVRGTVWLTEDRCDGTLVAVRRGVVDVRDAKRRRTVEVRAGGRYLARR